MRHKLKRVYIPKIRQYILILTGIIILFFSVQIIFYLSQVSRQTGLTPATIFRLLVNHGAPLKQIEGRTNVLIMGIGGGTHAGADLTDTMILLSLKVSENTLTLISIPRDIWSDVLQDKINSAYHYGEEKKRGGGLTLSKVAIEDVIGLPIHYSLIFDFSQFKKIIDIAGGIDVNAAHGFTDTNYPIDGKENDECDGDPLYTCRYQAVTFSQGFQHMDGERSLIYVRSRHANGSEGSDFARSRRQQEVMVALKDTMTSFHQWIHINQGIAEVRALDSATDTDMTLGELLTVLKSVSQVKSEKIQKVNIDQLFMIPDAAQFGGKYVLVPIESYKIVSKYIRDQIKFH